MAEKISQCTHPDDYVDNLGGNTYDCPPLMWCSRCGAVQEHDPKRGWAIPELMKPVRKAQCAYCKRIVEVNEKTRREFIITPRPDWEMDGMYCGCRGWD